MFCTKCGQKLDEGMAFCTRCGSRLPDISSPPVYYGAPEGGGQMVPRPKSKTGLIVGLSIGGAVLVIAVILLVVLLPGGGYAGLAGTWYDEDGFNGTVDFRGNGNFDMQTAGMTLSGKYTFDPHKMTGRLTTDYFGQSNETVFKLDGDRLNINGVWYTRDYVEQFDYNDMFKDFDMGDFLN